MTDLERWVMLGALAFGTLLTRFIPFWFFPEHKPIPSWLKQLGDRLPYASLGMLLIYALKDVNLAQAPHGASEGLSLMLITLVHRWRKNTLLSIFTGLVFYLLCVNWILK